MKIKIQNFRAIEEFSWAPEGVQLLAGAPGSGKSTLCRAVTFLRNLFLWGAENALSVVHPTNIQTFGADLTTFEVCIGDLRWVIEIHPTLEIKESLSFDGEPKDIPQKFSYENRCLAKIAYDRGEGWLEPLHCQMRELRTYQRPDLDTIRQSGSQDTTYTLHSTGKNLWGVLANWKASPIQYEGRFEWVMERMVEIYPSLVGALEFDRGMAFFYHPEHKTQAHKLPPHLMSDTALSTLCHLTTIAGAQKGSVVIIDDFDSQNVLEASVSRAEEVGFALLAVSESDSCLEVLDYGRQKTDM